MTDTMTFIAHVAREAGKTLERKRSEKRTISTKPDKSIVTDADLAAESVILSHIRDQYPEDMILSEESGRSGHEKRAGRYIWIIDPLDGTSNFANGYPFYCVSIGRGVVGDDGRIDMRAGAIYVPNRDALYLAEKGSGATRNGERITVGDERPFSSSFLVTGFYYMQGDVLAKELGRFARIANECQTIRRDGSAALDLAMVADGTFDGFWELGLQPWDVAAGSLLVSEARGVVWNYAPKEDFRFDLEGVGLIAGNASTVRTLHGFIRDGD